jgi:hypothetical protein
MSNALSFAVTTTQTVETFNIFPQKNIKTLSNCNCAVVSIGYGRAEV